MARLKHLFLSCWRETIAHEQLTTRSRRFNTYQNDLHSYSLEHCLCTCHGLNHKAKIIITTTSVVWSMSTCAITCRAIFMDTTTTRGLLNLRESQDTLLYAAAGWCQSKDFAVRLVNRSWFKLSYSFTFAIPSCALRDPYCYHTTFSSSLLGFSGSVESQ